MNSATSAAVRLCAFIWFAAFLSFGCASTRTINAVNDPTGLESLNNKIKDRWVMVTLQSGQLIYAENVSIRPDSTTFDEPHGRSGVSVLTKSVSQIRWNDHVVGIGRGAMAGAVMGTIYTAVFRPMFPAGVGGGQQPLSLAGGAIIGCVLGAWPGFVVGQENIYELRSDSTQSSE